MEIGARAGLGCRRRTEEGFGFADEWIGGTYIVGNMSLCGIVEVRKATDNNPENDKRREALRARRVWALTELR